ncbi:MAG: thiamine-phosphate pyrophosphorylase [Thermoleophilaceae bacterium]|nr:thiamine-phosphate pyrophosphorylase [Thermoleophilaceae bacterium]
MSSPADPRERLRAARLYLILESSVRGRAAAEVVGPALAGGVDVVQLRDKSAGDDEIVATGRELRELCERHGALFAINDRVDLALRCGAHGVHLGQDDERVDAARRQAGDRLLIGVSTHSPEQIAAGEGSAADYLGVGPVHETPTKPGRSAVGLELVRHAAAHADKPWFAIGGIDAGNAPAVVAAGARRVAVVRAIRDAADPERAARELRAAIDAEALVGQAV